MTLPGDGQRMTTSPADGGDLAASMMEMMEKATYYSIMQYCKARQVCEQSPAVSTTSRPQPIVHTKVAKRDRVTPVLAQTAPSCMACIRHTHNPQSSLWQKQKYLLTLI